VNRPETPCDSKNRGKYPVFPVVGSDVLKNTRVFPSYLLWLIAQPDGETITGGRKDFRNSAPAASRSQDLILMKIEPLGDKIVVKRLESDERTAGGILLPDSAREKPQQGRVLAVGPGRLLADGSRAKPQVNEGDRIIFSKYSGTEIEVNQAEVLIISESDVLAISN
jgi:chaperonin GroES